MCVTAACALLFTSWLLTLSSLKAEVLDVTCYTGEGRNYRGTVAMTISGRTCQSWSVQTPHSHPFTPENCPYRGLENNNYCRNPGSNYKKPYCLTTEPQRYSESCEIPQCVGVPEPIVPELSCFTCTGENYRGTVNTTESGYTCQRWSVQTPHRHLSSTPENQPHAGLENNNYCRNPDHGMKPWCYTTDPQKLWEFCEIPRCVPGGPQTSPTLLIPVVPVLHTSDQLVDTLLNDGPKNVLLAVDPPGDVVKGSSITLTCSGIGSHPPIHSYILLKDNTAVAQKNTMTISNVQPSHSGTYHCEAWNDIAVVDSPPLTVDVHYPPEITSVSVSPPGGVVERSNVTLSCSSDANPPVDTYTWYKDRSSISTGPQLVKENVSLTDSGQYICLVKNTHGFQRSSPHSLDVRSPMLPTHCGRPEVYRSNSIMISRMKSRYAPRVTVVYECMVGYTMTGGRSGVRCVAGKWTPLTQTCEGQCGRRTDPTGNKPLISGGTPSRLGDHPWQVSLQHRAKGTSNAFGHKCGGVLIDSCWVLTAAHCIDSTKDMQVVVGGVDVGSKERSDQVISVERDFVHPDYREILNEILNETTTTTTTHFTLHTTNDIALLKLKVTEDPFCAKETSYVKYACLPNKLFPDGKDCVVAGWGSTENADHPKHMSHGQLSLMSEERCKVFHGSQLDDSMICAGDKLGRVGSCSGDSGGPLICKDKGVYYIAGLVSWGSATCGASIPGVYANVHRYVEWISGCIAHNGSPCKTQSVYVDECDYDCAD